MRPLPPEGTLRGLRSGPAGGSAGHPKASPSSPPGNDGSRPDDGIRLTNGSLAADAGADVTGWAGLTSADEISTTIDLGQVEENLVAFRAWYNAWEIAFGESPDWSAVDGQIVYRGCGPRCEVWGLYVMNDQGTGQELLVADPSATAPAWSPSGDEVAFMSNRDGNWELYVVNEDGSGLRRLTNNAANDGLPTWSPDGQSLAFVSDRGGVWAVWAIHPDGSGQRKLFDIGGGGLADDWQEEQISWAP